MNKKILILFPKDATTDFLDEIVDYLSKNVNPALFAVVRVEGTDQSHKIALKQITDPVYGVVIFLGHGTSSALYGAVEAKYKNETFITSKNFQVFKKKSIILVSCESKSLLKKQKAVGIIEAIGFGDLPTDWKDISSARESDINAYKGLTPDLTSLFRIALVEILKYSLADFINRGLSITQLYELLLLRTNKRIVKYYLVDRIAMTPVSDTLLRMKQELTLMIK